MTDKVLAIFYLFLEVSHTFKEGLTCAREGNSGTSWGNVAWQLLMDKIQTVGDTLIISKSSLSDHFQKTCLTPSLEAFSEPSTTQPTSLGD